MARMMKTLTNARGLIAFLIAISFGVVMACETPVYRYAMYRWQPTPYEVYFFHDHPVGPADQQVADRLAEYADAEGNRANVAYIPIDLAGDPELNSVPKDVREAWEQREDKTLPTYFISTPYGAGLSFEQLTADDVTALVESPARKSLAAQLETGKICVFVMLTGKDAAENDEAEQIMTDLCDEVRDGKISLYVAPTEEAATAKSEATQPKFDIGFIKIDRESQEERWLVRSLLAMEADLPQETRPMVFLCYGRARALLPYIGQGITRENLIHELEFISGACSCTVKEQNPGVDLLVRYDWESAATALSDKFGTEEGNEGQYNPDMFFPELIFAGDATGGQPAAPADADNTVADEENIAAADTADEPAVGQTQPNESSHVVEVSAPDAKPAESSAEVAALPKTDQSAAAATATQSSGSLTSVWIVGGGVAVAVVILFGLTFVVLRPQ